MRVDRPPLVPRAQLSRKELIGSRFGGFFCFLKTLKNQATNINSHSFRPSNRRMFHIEILKQPKNIVFEHFLIFLQFS